jgi:hypothetical protein
MEIRGVRRILVTVLGVLAAFGLTACGLADRAGSAQDSSLSPEAQTLVAMGFSDAQFEPAAVPSANPDGGHRVRPGRIIKLHKNLLHGEAVVQTDSGPKTIDVQRGAVTAVDDKSVTVKSTDGFTLTWTFGTPLRVIKDKAPAQPSALKVGNEIGVAGTKDGGTVSAHLIVIPKP